MSPYRGSGQAARSIHRDLASRQTGGIGPMTVPPVELNGRVWLWEIGYLATPYTRYPAGIRAAFADAAKLAARLLVTGLKVYSPITHTHPLAIYGHLDPLDHAIW